MLQGSIATDKDSRLSWKDDKPEKVRESVIRFAESEKDEEEEESDDEDVDKVIDRLKAHTIVYRFNVVDEINKLLTIKLNDFYLF